MLSSDLAYFDLAYTSHCNLAKMLKPSDLFKAAKNLTYYQPRPLILNVKILLKIEIKLICFNLCHTDSIQYALNCFLWCLIFILVVIYCKSSIHLHFNI